MPDAFDTSAILSEIEAGPEPSPSPDEKLIRMSARTWEVFIGALIGLKMPGVTGEAFYRLPLVEETVEAVRDAEDA